MCDSLLQYYVPSRPSCHSSALPQTPKLQTIEDIEIHAACLRTQVASSIWLHLYRIYIWLQNLESSVVVSIVQDSGSSFEELARNPRWWLVVSLSKCGISSQGWRVTQLKSTIQETQSPCSRIWHASPSCQHHTSSWVAKAIKAQC